MKYPLTRAQVFVLAEMAGVCESTVRRYLRGDRSFERAADAIQGALKRPECAAVAAALRRWRR